jgi:hypothetical protein
MPSVPRILRLAPTGQVTRPPDPIPVIATVRWQTGDAVDIEAHATAWTRDAVQIIWSPDGDPPRTDWIPAIDVRRHGQAPRTSVAGDEPPRSHSRRRPRW